MSAGSIKGKLPPYMSLYFFLLSLDGYTRFGLSVILFSHAPEKICLGVRLRHEGSIMNEPRRDPLDEATVHSVVDVRVRHEKYGQEDQHHQGDTDGVGAVEP